MESCGVILSDCVELMLCSDYQEVLVKVVFLLHIKSIVMKIQFFVSEFNLFRYKITFFLMVINNRKADFHGLVNDLWSYGDLFGVCRSNTSG